MNSVQREFGIINLICFMVVSARELVNEPPIYGQMRLIEATQRLIHLVEDNSLVEDEDNGIHHKTLTEVVNRIEGYPLDALPEGEERFIEFLDELIAFLASRVEQFHFASEGNNQEA